MNPEHFNILLADDDKDDCLLFKEALEELPLTAKLKMVHDGEQLMNMLLKKSADTLPHVLFLDLNMPRKNGFECLAEIKQQQKLKQLPVIIFSTSFDREIVSRLKQQGAQYYIQKPAEFCKLKNVIHQALLFTSKETFFANGMKNFVIRDESTFIHS